jgi:hypothetical protein
MTPRSSLVGWNLDWKDLTRSVRTPTGDHFVMTLFSDKSFCSKIFSPFVLARVTHLMSPTIQQWFHRVIAYTYH